MFGLGHMDLGPLVYGLVIFLGLYSMWWKLTRHKYLSLMIEVVVFVLVFNLHGGTMAGGFAATIAALLAGVFFPVLIKGKNPPRAAQTWRQHAR